MRVLYGAAFCVLVGQAAWAGCAPDVVTVQGDWGKARFRVEIADDPAERNQGLMFVEELGMLEGMLFLYESPRPVSFWMKNTILSLDMLFVGPRGKILRVHENAVPGDETGIPGGDGILAVLEVNGGLAARLGITVGDRLQHPAFGTDAILPCN